MTTESADKTMRGAIGPLLATFSIQAIVAMTFFGVAATAPKIGINIISFGSLVGVIFAAIVIGTCVLGGLLTGAFADRFGAVRIGQILMALALLAVALFTLSTVLAAMVSTVLLACCYAAANPVSTHILARVTSKDWRPLFFAINQTGMWVGAGLAGLLLPLVTAVLDWRVGILAAGVLAAVVALLIQPLRNSLDAGRQPARLVRLIDVVTPLKLVLRDSRLRSLAVVGLIYTGGYITVVTFYAVYVFTTFSLPLTTAALLLAALQVGAFLGRLFWGAVAERYLPAAPLLVWLGAATAGMVVIVSFYDAGWPIWSVGLVSFMLGATSAGWNGVFFSEMVEYAPADRIGETASGMQVFILAGLAAVAPVLGVVIDVTGDYRVAFAIVAAAMVAAAVHHKVVFR